MSNQCGCNHWTKPVCPEASCPWNEWKAQQNTAASKIQRKPWVGLSTDEIYDMYNEPRSDAEMLEFARAIEAAHGIGEQK